ncbi:MAG: chromate transporter [Paludibacteraceae bacterium]|nr:chromate transporter [Paludibacteraceae bacterium]
MIYLQLFISFLKVGFLGFGGGMAIISLIQHEVISHGWLTQTEFVDIVGISQVTPGPIGMNCATYVGYTATGTIWGSLLASFAIVVPSLIIMSVVCYIYDRIRDHWSDNRTFQITMRVIRCLVVVLIAHAAYTLMTPESFVDGFSWIIFGVVAVCTLLPMVQRNKVIDVVSHPILLICLAGLVGYLIY